MVNRNNPVTLLVSVAVGALALLATLSVALAQTNGVTASDPLSAYVGTWLATDPGDATPFLVLTLREVNGILTGTMSPFRDGGVRDGHIVWRPLPIAVAEISHLTISNSSLGFHWTGSPPLDGGDVKFVADGTDFAYANIPLSQEEAERIFHDNPGLGGLEPTIHLRRAGIPSAEYQKVASADDEREESVVRLINEAEFQYKFDHGIFADYSTLLYSGQLKRTTGSNFTISPLDLHPQADPLPGHILRLSVSPDGGSYRISIQWEASAGCDVTLSGDESGAVAEGRTGKCATASR